MGDNSIQTYKKSTIPPISHWVTESGKLQKQLAPIDDELKKLEANRSPSADDKKKIAALRKKRDALRVKIEAASIALGKALVALPPPKSPDQKEVVHLPSFLEDIIKDKGAVPLGDGVSIKPTASFDFKKMQFKKVEVKLIWRF